MSALRVGRDGTADGDGDVVETSLTGAFLIDSEDTQRRVTATMWTPHHPRLRRVSE